MSPKGVLDRLETDRLVLRPGRADDASCLRQMWSERDPRVPSHRRINADGQPTLDDIVAGIEAAAEVPGLGLLTVERKVAPDVVGYCGLIAHGDGSTHEPELAYELLRVAQGNGYATEAAEAVVEWASEAGYRRIWARVWDWNVASRRVLQKLGFNEVGQVEPHSVHGHTLMTVRDL